MVEASKAQPTHQVNAVHKMQIYEEVVAKEMKHFSKNRTKEYTINPFTMQKVTDKPNHKNQVDSVKKTQSSNLTDDTVGRAFQLNAMKRKIQTASMQPRQKYQHQQTSNQEIGWFINPLVPQNDQF